MPLSRAERLLLDTSPERLHPVAVPTTTSTIPRVLARRQAVVDEALDHAVTVIGEAGVGGLTVSELARRMGMRAPSLYKYFPSLHAVYDALFARGLAGEMTAVRQAMDGLEPGVARLRAGGRALVRWCVENPSMAQLLHWRPVPGFEPSPETFAASREDMGALREDFARAVQHHQLDRRADSDDAVRLYTVVLGGVLSQQLANQPGVAFDDGDFSRLTDEALDMFFDHYRPGRST